MDCIHSFRDFFFRKKNFQSDLGKDKVDWKFLDYFYMSNQWKFFIDLISNRDYLLLTAFLLLIYVQHRVYNEFLKVNFSFPVTLANL